MQTLPNPTITEEGTLDVDSYRKYTEILKKIAVARATDATVKPNDVINTEERIYMGKCVDMMNQGKIAASMVPAEEAEKIYENARNEAGEVDPSKLPVKKVDPDLLIAGNKKYTDTNAAIESVLPQETEFYEGEAELLQQPEPVEPEATQEEINAAILESANKILGEEIAKIPGLQNLIDSIKQTSPRKIKARFVNTDQLVVYTEMTRKQMKVVQSIIDTLGEDADTEVLIIQEVCVYPDFKSMTADHIDEEFPPGVVAQIAQLIMDDAGYNGNFTMAFDI